MASLSGLLRRLRRQLSAVSSFIFSGRYFPDREDLGLCRQVLAQSDDAVLIAKFDGAITYVNAAFERITGYTANDVIGRQPSILKSGEHSYDFYSRLWAQLKGRRSFHGVFINRNKNGLLFHEEKTIFPIIDRSGRVTHYISTGRNVSERTAAEQRLHRLANYDTLTGLPNRKLFLKQLEEYIEQDISSTDCLIMLLDINSLKKINDTLGHSAGDQALRMIASRLQSYCSDTCIVARWGGDEFIVLVRDCGNFEKAHSVAQSALTLLGQALELVCQEVFLSASIGIARYPSDSSDPEDLIRNADLALHQAKESGRNVFCFYQASMRNSLREDLQIESALHGALVRNELYLVFQPVVRTKDRMLMGLEALLRWNSPTLGSIPPERFIPQLERNGMIIPVGRWILETACKEVAELRSRDAFPLRLAVNVSARQLLHPSFPADVKAAIEKSGLSPDRLDLEITESILIENTAMVAEVLRDLCRLGLRIAADDFGTGYSSLNYLWKFPFGTLKIDRSFVMELSSDAEVQVIVSSILTLARGLGLQVVAEGIETAAQFELLKTLGCPLIQGYWTGRPLPMAEIRKLLQPQAYGV